MKKILQLINHGGEETKFVLEYELNQLIIEVVIRRNDFWKNVFSKVFVITDEFNLDELIDKTYSEYLKLKEIELIWKEELEPMEVIELNLDIDDEDIHN